MQTSSRWSGPPVREVVWEAVLYFTGGDVNVEFAIKDIKAIILRKYPDFNVRTIGSQIRAGCVNSTSRHHHSADIDRYWKVELGVYRLYESNQQTDLDKISEKIKEISKVSGTGDYIYRGEPACHKKPPYNGNVNSGLYRQYLNLGIEHFNVAAVQQEILKQARGYAPHKMDDFEILATLQHFGDKTNLIDFTTDYLIALFFACDGDPEKPGRVILFQRRPEGDPKPYEVIPAPRTIPRADVQKSIFVQAPKGFVEVDKFVCIPKGLKRSILNYLRKHHDISTKTIYNDLHGFIETRRLHRSAYEAFHKGVTSQDRADSAKTVAERQEGYNNAITHYTEAIDLNPENVGAYNNRGIVYCSIGDFEASIEDFNRAIDLSPEDARVYNNRGSAYFGKSDFEAAIVDFNKAIELDPEYTEAYNNRGNAYRDTGDFEAAIADFNKAIELDPEYTEAYNNRGVAYRDTGDFGAAIEDYNKAMDLDPEDAGVYNNRGNAYRDTGDFGAAVENYNKAIELDPEYAGVYNNRGFAYRGIGDFGAAIEDYNKSIDLDPENAGVYNNRGIAYRGIGDFEASIEDFNKAIDLNPEDASVYNDRGNTYFVKSDFESAIEDFNKAIDLAPENALIYSNRGSAYRGIGDFEAAIADYSKSIDLDPENAGVYNNRGIAYSDIGDFEAAVADFKKAIELAPKNAAAYCDRGKARLHLKEWQRAKADLTTAKNMGYDIIASFQNDYESVEDFETKNKVKVPEDIAALLQ